MGLEEQRKFYDQYWRNGNAISISKRRRIVEIFERISRYCPPKSSLRILDLGCGDGRSVTVWSLLGVPSGLELSPDAVRHARKMYPEFEILEGDATRTPFDDGAFDIVVSQELIEHIDDQVGLIAECRRILKVDGFLALTTPNKYYFDRRRGGNYSNQPIEKIVGPKRLAELVTTHGFEIVDFCSIVPKRGHFGIYFVLDRVLSHVGPLRTVIDYFKNKFLLSAHLIIVARNIK